MISITTIGTIMITAYLLMWIGGFLSACAEDRADRRERKLRRALWMRDWGHDPAMVKKFDEQNV